MKLILIMVVSLDGKTTRGDESKVYRWTSKEDQTHFFATLKKGTAFIMGKKTFKAAESIICPSHKKYFAVLVPNPTADGKTSIPGQLEFTNERPHAILRKIEKMRHKKAYLLGGEFTNTEFFKMNLVDEILLTIEPVMFGSGNSIIKRQIPDVKLVLKKVKRLNKRGTLLLTYKVLK